MRDVLEFWITGILHSHPEIEISFKFIPKILMSKECIHFLGHSAFYEKHRIIRYVTTAIINTSSSFNVLLTVHLGVILVTDQLNAQIHFL